jgi:hypothetical protein
MLCQNVGNCLYFHTANHPRRLESSSRLLGEPQISIYHVCFFLLDGEAAMVPKCVLHHT